MIDSRQLRYFAVLAQHMHFGRAAEALSIAQSAVSSQIKRLEEDLGVRLFNRRKRSAVSLTDAGRMFLVEAQAALRQIERADRIGRLAGRGEIGQVELAYVVSAAMSGVLSEMLGAFRRAHPSVLMRLTTMDTPSQLRAISDGLVDVGLVRSRAAYPEGIAAQVVHHDQLLLAINVNSPLLRHPVIRARDLASECFIVPQFAETEGFTENLARLGRAGGFHVHAAHSVGDFITAISMAAGDYGVALVPGSFERLGIGGVTFRKVEDYADSVSLSLAWLRTESSPSVRAFVASARACQP